jgi:hypothetical protein
MPHKETEMAKWILSAALLLMISAASAHAGIACGEAVASHETGVLSDDLTCDESPAVLLEPEGRLDLRGHTIALRGGGAAIECIGGGCMIFSTSADRAAIALDKLGDAYGVRAEGVDPALPVLSVQNVDISGGRSGIYAPGANVEINVVSVSDASDSGIVADDLRAFNVAAIGNGRAGLSADTVDINCATISTNRSADVVSVDSAPSLGPYVTCGSSVDGLDASAQSWDACPSER